MKTFLIFIACCCLLIACRKKNCTANELVGNWKLVETGRIFQPWQPIHASQQLTLSFHNDYTFTQTLSPLSSSTGCSGTYRIINNNRLVMTFFCQSMAPYDDEVGFTKNGDTLILDHYNTATGIKTKYVRQ